MSVKKEAPSDTIWQDRDIRFDLDSRLLRLIAGEHLIERIDGVEDTKGNNGDKGVLRVTNIRLIWHATSTPRINLSIGYNSINGVTTRLANSKIRGQAESLYLIARNSSTRFEFIFTCVNPTQTKLFTTVIAIHRAYETSKLYRELKMRGAVINEEEKLRVLPLEHQCDRFEGVWNLSSDQGNLGVLILTNIRIVWFASMNSMYNVSIPYLQLHCCRIRDSKFGLALVIETSAISGEYVLGFRVDPEEKLQNICRTIQVLHKAFIAKPIFGVQHNRERPGTPQAVGEIVEQVEEDVELDERPLRADAFAAYFSDGITSEEIRPPVYSEELGVAIEQLKPGFTIADLWNIHVD
uniref:PH domain-containing protein n=2 Tax=Parascaris univalens TaxID=6257 RepID=A0A915AK44_PARUN